MPGPFIFTKTTSAGVVPITKAVGGPMPAIKGGNRTYTRVVKGKGGKAQLAVFDENGKLLGTIDPGDLNEVQSATPAEQKQVDQQTAAAQAQQDQQAQAAEAVTKAVADVLRPVKPRPVGVAKSAPASNTIRDVFTALLKSLEPGRADALRGVVSHQSLALMTGHGVPAPTAIATVKKAAIQVARVQGLI